MPPSSGGFGEIMGITDQQENECLAFINAYISDFGCIPLTFEASNGEVFSYADVRVIADKHQLTAGRAN